MCTEVILALSAYDGILILLRLSFCRIQLEINREEQALAKLGLPGDSLNISGGAAGGTRKHILKAATETSTETGDECHIMCTQDPR